MSVADRLKSERERLGLTQPQVALATAVGKTTVINWEKGASSPTATQLSDLAGLGMDVLFVITGQYAGNSRPAPTMSAEEQTMVAYMREASPALRKAALRVLMDGHTPAQHATSGGVNVSGSVGGDVLGGGAIKAGGDVTAPGGVSAKVSRSFFGVAIGKKG